MWMRRNRLYDPGITTRKITSNLLEMSKQKSVEKQNDGKRGKITSFLIPKEQRENGKFTTLPRAVRSLVWLRSVKLVGLFVITSSRGGFQACDNSYRFRNTILHKPK